MNVGEENFTDCNPVEGPSSDSNSQELKAYKGGNTTQQHTVCVHDVKYKQT